MVKIKNMGRDFCGGLGSWIVRLWGLELSLQDAIADWILRPDILWWYAPRANADIGATPGMYLGSHKNLFKLAWVWTYIPVCCIVCCQSVHPGMLTQPETPTALWAALEQRWAGSHRTCCRKLSCHVSLCKRCGSETGSGCFACTVGKHRVMSFHDVIRPSSVCKSSCWIHCAGLSSHYTTSPTQMSFQCCSWACICFCEELDPTSHTLVHHSILLFDFHTLIDIQQNQFMLYGWEDTNIFWIAAGGCQLRQVWGQIHVPQVLDQ